MNSFFERIKTWLLPIMIVILVLVGLIYLQKSFDLPAIFVSDGTEENAKNPKGFAKSKNMSENEQLAQDQAALNGALHSGALSDCEKIIYNPELKKTCEDQLIYAQSLREENVTGCEKIEDNELKKLCENKAYFSTASDENNPLICQKISDSVLQVKCQEEINFSLAKSANTQEACDRVTSLDYKMKCLDNYFLKQTAQTEDATGCSKLSTQNLQQECTKVISQNKQVALSSQKADAAKKVIRSTLELLSLCDSVADTNQQTSCKNTIYPRLAFEEKDLNYCQKIIGTELVQSCLSQQGQALDEYYLRKAKAEDESTWCEKISSEPLKSLCLKN